MRIAHVTATFPPYLAGTGYVAFYQARELANLGHEVHVYTAAMGGGSDTIAPQGVHVHRLPPLVRVGNAPVLPGLLKLSGFDIIHLHYPFISGAELTWAACRWRKIPYLINYHNDLIGVGLRDKIFRTYNRAFRGLVIRQAALTLAVTQDHALNCQASAVFNRYHIHVEELLNGVDTSHFAPKWDRQIIRDTWGIPANKKLILFVGALDQAHLFKNVPLLLRAFCNIANPETRLMIVGDGDMRDVYQSESIALGIEKLVSFVGNVPHSDLPGYYAASDIVILPSNPPESFGLVIIEGMACGRPVIGTRIPGLRSLIEEGVDGLLAQPNDAIDLEAKMITLLDLSPDERRRMGLAGRRKAEERFSWQVIGQRLEQIYAQIRL